MDDYQNQVNKQKEDLEFILRDIEEMDAKE